MEIQGDINNILRDIKKELVVIMALMEWVRV